MRLLKNVSVGKILFMAVICVLVVFLVEDARYKAPEVKFDEPPVLSENAVDLNTATFEELQAVEGIGERTAEKIIEFREKERPFETIQDLMHIKGFAVKKLENLLGKVYVK